MKDQQPCPLLHRNAIVLNNLGLRFLEEGQFQVGVATIQGALTAMKASVTGEADLAMLEKKVAAAVQRASQPVIVFSGNDHAVDCISDDNWHENLDRALATRPCFVRIADDDSGRDPAIDTAIVLYNFGLACLLGGNRQKPLKLLRLCKASLQQAAIDPMSAGQVFFLSILLTYALATILADRPQGIECRRDLTRLRLVWLERKAILSKMPMAAGAA